MKERVGRLIAIGAVAITLYASKDRDNPRKNAAEPTKPGMPAEISEDKKTIDPTIANLVKELKDYGFDLPMQIATTVNGQKHIFFCHTKLDQCLWYPPKEKGFPGAGDISLYYLDTFLSRGTTITILGNNPNSTAGIRIKHQAFLEALESFNADFILLNPEEGTVGEYLKEGASFYVENNAFIAPQVKV